jgi:predicted MPP superfamily phosphohydrolase
LLALLLIFAGKAYYDTNTIKIKHYRIDHLGLGKVLGGLKIAHLSDLHIKSPSVMGDRILEILKKEKPDLIFITGDFISFGGPYGPVISFLHQLKAPFGIYAVMGNADYYNENGSCALCHQKDSKNLEEKQNPIFLRNSIFTLKMEGGSLNLIGVDDPVTKKSNLKTALKGMNPDNPSILLSHSPEIFEEASGLGFDFLLSGHNHGGQIFGLKYLRKIFPFDPSLEFLDGFFQKGRMLMYVNQGIGTSYLPFRLGPKPEITFFKFGKELRHSNPSKYFTVSNAPPTTLFTGFSLSNVVDTFNLFNHIHLSDSGPYNKSDKLFDFESEEDLKQLNWECHKWFELSEEHATSGKHSLKVILPPGQYPGIVFGKIKSDWSKSNYFKMDVFNSSEEELKFHIRIDDHKSGWEYANRFDVDFNLKQGMNHLSIPSDSIRTNIQQRPLILKRIERMIVFLPNNSQKKEIYIDNIRLE